MLEMLLTVNKTLYYNLIQNMKNTEELNLE